MKRTFLSSAWQSPSLPTSCTHGPEIHTARLSRSRATGQPARPTAKRNPPHLRLQYRICPWRKFFTDEKLQKIIETALTNNRDLRVAALNVERARALYGIQSAALLPTVNATGSAVKTLGCRLIFRLPGTRWSPTIQRQSRHQPPGK